MSDKVTLAEQEPLAPGSIPLLYNLLILSQAYLATPHKGLIGKWMQDSIILLLPSSRWVSDVDNRHE